jgi:hypothetical protein
MRSWKAAGLLLLAGLGNATEPAPDGLVDPATGLIVGPGWELARAHCGACHSYRLVTAQAGDEDFWLGTIRWMQSTQNLWPIAPEQEEVLIGYLATFYPPDEWGRRPPLPQSLMP